MARIFDNIDQDLLGASRATMQASKRSDFCVGYLNLRGWQAIDDLITPWDPTAGQVCRVLVGMHQPTHEVIRELYRQTDASGLIDNATASRLIRSGVNEGELAGAVKSLREEGRLTYAEGAAS